MHVRMQQYNGFHGNSEHVSSPMPHSGDTYLWTNTKSICKAFRQHNT
jgi:lysozyme family protein